MMYVHRSHFKCYSFKKCLRCSTIKKIKFEIRDKPLLAKLDYFGPPEFETSEVPCSCSNDSSLTSLDKWLDNAGDKEIDEYFKRRKEAMNSSDYMIFDTHEDYD